MSGQLGLVAERPFVRELSPGCIVELHRGWLSATESERHLALFVAELAWEHRWFTPPGGWQDPVRMPRLECVYGGDVEQPALAADARALPSVPSVLSYRYSGQTYYAKPWTPELARLRTRVSVRCGVEFTAVFCNEYRDEHDSIGWHSDFEPNLGPRHPDDITIASLSLGATRRFQLSPKQSRDGDRALISYDLAAGDLLVMRGATQRDWLHRVPKTSAPTGPRVNLTWRVLR